MTNWRSLFISDPHFDALESRGHMLFEFLPSVHCETLYLAGDMFDAWANPNVQWPDGFRALLAATADRVIHIRGNHDPRWYKDIALPYAIHTTAKGVKVLVEHGSRHDPYVRGPFWRPTAILGTRVNEWLMRVTGFSMAKFLAQDEDAPKRFWTAVYEEAERRGCAGFICGHSHKSAEPRLDETAPLYDMGCWYGDKPLTYVAEDFEGNLSLQTYTPERV